VRRVSEPDAYAALHAAIVAGSLSPGERLVEEELAERLGCSRGAVRAALMRLGHEGLVVRERNRGARVRRFTVEEAIEILEARAALESLAAGYAALRRTGAEARELQSLVADMGRLQRSGELLAMSERNAVMHRRILEISRHEVAHDICARLHSQVVRFQFRTVLAPGRSTKSLAEHRAIVEAIVAGDRRRAERAMRDHLTKVAAALTAVAAPERIAL
jgi:DNA-binding GntR family transcriptional regulator